MKEIIRRTLIIFWLIAIAGVFVGVYNFSLFDWEAWEISVGFSALIWTLQFILIGVVNPFALVRAKTEQQA